MLLWYRSNTNKVLLPLESDCLRGSREGWPGQDGEQATLLMSLMAEYTNVAVTAVAVMVAEHCMIDYKRQLAKWYRASFTASTS
jgi:hypothetical protein